MIFHTSICLKALCPNDNICGPTPTPLHHTHLPPLMNFNAFGWIQIFCLGYPLKNKQSVVALGT